MERLESSRHRDNFSVSDLWAGTTTSAVGHVAQTGGTLNVGVSMVIAQNGGTADYDMSGVRLTAQGPISGTSWWITSCRGARRRTPVLRRSR